MHLHRGPLTSPPTHSQPCPFLSGGAPTMQPADIDPTLSSAGPLANVPTVGLALAALSVRSQEGKMWPSPTFPPGEQSRPRPPCPDEETEVTPCPRHQGGDHICAGLGSPGIPVPGSFLQSLGGGQEGGPCRGPSEIPRTLSGLVWLWDHDSCPLAPPPACRPPPPGQQPPLEQGRGPRGSPHVWQVLMPTLPKGIPSPASEAEGGEGQAGTTQRPGSSPRGGAVG